MSYTSNQIPKYVSAIATRRIVDFQLKELLQDGRKFVIPMNALILTAFMFLRYPKWLMAYDMTFMVLYLIFKKFVFPSMLSGKIKAYYRRSYFELAPFSLILMPVTIGAVMRGLIVILFAVIRNLLHGTLSLMPKSLLINLLSIGTPVAILFFAFSIYLLFYMDKYVTIKRYCKVIGDMAKSKNLDYPTCTSIFIKQRDNELKNKNNTTKEDYKVSELTVSPEIMENNESKRHVESSEDKNIVFTETVNEIANVDNNPVSDIISVRRKARI